MEAAREGEAQQDVAEERARAEMLARGVRAIQTTAAGGFPQYAAERLKIKDKSGKLIPFILNSAQMYVHRRAEEQRDRTGKVRRVLLKGRQMGLSTYVNGRGYYKTTRQIGQNAFILAHDLPTTGKLFTMVKTFHDFMDERLKPTVGKSNEKELLFTRLRGGYAVGTAKEGATGRGTTVQFFHGSEVAFWRAASEIMTGVFQAVGGVEGTEVWLESTANGAGFFKSMVQAARKGETDFELDFLPWFWDPGYTTQPAEIPRDFEDELSVADREYQAAYGLTLGQMHWRSKKIAEFTATEGGSVEAGTAKFGQEYPATIEEAFVGEAEDAFIRAIPVVLARKRWREWLEQHGGDRPVGYGKKVMGIDPSFQGSDKFTLWMRQGRVAWKAGGWQRATIQQSLSRCLLIFEKEQPDEIFIDASNGGSLFDLLSAHEVWGPRIVPVLFGDPADEPDRHYNKRCEMWSRTREWLQELPGAILEDREDIQADLTGVPKVPDTTGNRTKLMSKDQMRAKKLPSPDDGDGLCLTFAYPSIQMSYRGGAAGMGRREEVFHGDGM